LSHSSVDKMASGDSWESYIPKFRQYAQSKQLHPQDLDDVLEEAQNRIAKMFEAGKPPPKGLKALFKFAYGTVLQKREREQKRSKRISEAVSSSSRDHQSKRDHEHYDPGLVDKTLLLHGFSERDATIIRATCLSNDRSKCPEGLKRPSSREHHARKLGVSYETVHRIAERFEEELKKRILIEKFISLRELGSLSESPEQWKEFLGRGIFLGKIAMALDTADADKLNIGYAITKHLPDLCKRYADLVLRPECLEDPEDFNVLLSIEELLFLGCRYASPYSRDTILSMCEDLKKHQQSRPFFFDRLLRLLPAYCVDQEEERHWQDLWRFYEMDENDKRFSLDSHHLHAYNQLSSALWHRLKDFLLERSNKAPEDAYRLKRNGLEYTLHALTKAAAAYIQNPALQRMSLYWVWECFRFLPVKAKDWSKLYAAVEKLNCYQENKELKHMLLNRFRPPGLAAA
jgi:hypothetical protein